MTQPWLLKKMCIENSSEIHKSYEDAFSVTLETRAQLLTLDLRRGKYYMILINPLQHRNANGIKQKQYVYKLLAD